MIISEELMRQNGTILSDFSRYIKYFSEAGQIRESKIYSVFDLMYKDYSRILEPLRAKLLRISNFDSENIIATLIKDCIDKKYKTFDFVHNYPLRKIINISHLSDELDRKFVSNENTHCDFIVYNCFDKKPYFVIEVDGKQHRKKVQPIEFIRDSCISYTYYCNSKVRRYRKVFSSYIKSNIISINI